MNLKLVLNFDVTQNSCKFDLYDEIPKGSNIEYKFSTLKLQGR